MASSAWECVSFKFVKVYHVGFITITPSPSLSLSPINFHIYHPQQPLFVVSSFLFSVVYAEKKMFCLWMVFFIFFFVYKPPPAPNSFSLFCSPFRRLSTWSTFNFFLIFPSLPVLISSFRFQWYEQAFQGIKPKKTSTQIPSNFLHEYLRLPLHCI